MVDAFVDADTLGRQVARLAESQNVDTGASPDRSEKYLKGAGGASDGRLVLNNIELPKVGVNSGTILEIDDHLHVVHLRKKRYTKYPSYR